MTSKHSYPTFAPIFAICLSFAPPAQALTNTPLDCPGVVSVSGGYKLTRNSNCGSNVITWLENNKFLDLGGFTLTAKAIATGGNGSTGNGIAIRNGTLVTDSIYWNGNGGVLTSLNLFTQSTAKTGFFIETGSNFTVNKCTFTNIPKVALSFYFGSGGKVLNSTFIGNSSAINLQRGNLNLGTQIQNNTFINNTQGISLWNEDFTGVNYNEISANLFLNNGLGISIKAEPPFLGYPTMQGNQIVNNRFLFNTHAGIYINVKCEAGPSILCSPGGMVVQGNQFDYNGYTASPSFPDINDGVKALASYTLSDKTIIYPAGLAGIILSRNRAYMNADLAFDVDGVTDGGGNTASFNKNPAQCEGVYCPPPLSASSLGTTETDTIEPALSPDIFESTDEVLEVPRSRHHPRRARGLE